MASGLVKLVAATVLLGAGAGAAYLYLRTDEEGRSVPISIVQPNPVVGSPPINNSPPLNYQTPDGNGDEKGDSVLASLAYDVRCFDGFGQELVIPAHINSGGGLEYDVVQISLGTIYNCMAANDEDQVLSVKIEQELNRQAVPGQSQTFYSEVRGYNFDNEAGILTFAFRREGNYRITFELGDKSSKTVARIRKLPFSATPSLDLNGGQESVGDFKIKYRGSVSL